MNSFLVGHVKLLIHYFAIIQNAVSFLRFNCSVTRFWYGMIINICKYLNNSYQISKIIKNNEKK